MKVISGQISCADVQEIPVGSVVFIYVSKGETVVGHQTLQSISHFPFNYTVELPDNELNEPGYTIRVSIENSENTIFLNDQGTTPIDEKQQLDKVDVQVHHYPEVKN